MEAVYPYPPTCETITEAAREVMRRAASWGGWWRISKARGGYYVGSAGVSCPGVPLLRVRILLTGEQTIVREFFGHAREIAEHAPEAVPHFLKPQAE